MILKISIRITSIIASPYPILHAQEGGGGETSAEASVTTIKQKIKRHLKLLKTAQLSLLYEQGLILTQQKAWV